MTDAELSKALEVEAERDQLRINSGWRPIETADKENGRHVLLFGDGPNFTRCAFVGCWWTYGEPHERGWRLLGTAMVCQPRCWMPLPEPPK